MKVQVHSQWCAHVGVTIESCMNTEKIIADLDSHPSKSKSAEIRFLKETGEER